MSEAAAPPRPTASANPRDGGQGRVSELKVSGQLLTLDTGLFCVVIGGPMPPQGSVLPGVRISVPPLPPGTPQSVAVSTFRSDGWLPVGEAALVRVTQGPAPVMVTIYQARDANPDQAPRLTVMSLLGDSAAAAAPRTAAGVERLGAATAGGPPAEVVSHIQRMGDVGGKIGEWVGTRGSRLWVEGFVIGPRSAIAPTDIEYQAVLGRDWLSPWVEGGNFCGSRGMALPLLGINVRLKGEAARLNDLRYTASFVDGSTVGPVDGGQVCQSEGLAALEAFQVVVTPKAQAPGKAPAAAGPVQREADGRKRPPAASAAKKSAARRGQ